MATAVVTERLVQVIPAGVLQYLHDVHSRMPVTLLLLLWVRVEENGHHKLGFVAISKKLRVLEGTSYHSLRDRDGHTHSTRTDTYMYAHVHAHTCTHLHMDTHTYSTHRHIHVAHTCMHTHAHTYTWTHAHTHTHTHTYSTHRHIHIRTHMHAYTCTQLHMDTHTHRLILISLQGVRSIRTYGQAALSQSNHRKVRRLKLNLNPVHLKNIFNGLSPKVLRVGRSICTVNKNSAVKKCLTSRGASWRPKLGSLLLLEGETECALRDREWPLTTPTVSLRVRGRHVHHHYTMVCIHIASTVSLTTIAKRKEAEKHV